MTVPMMTRSLRRSLEELVALFREDQATDFIASEFLISHQILENVKPGTSLARALEEGERTINKVGFQWWTPPVELRQLVEQTRNKVARSTDDEAVQVLLSLLTEDEPEFLVR